MKNGKIGVTTENIFPVIKKFLYSDHEIFLRELISNAVDATQKLKTLSSIGEAKGDLGDVTIRVAADKEKKTLTVTDRGVGMTAEEVDKYINQIAFSGAEEFMEKYKNQAIIGHFGLGFYSAFMVSDKVEIFTKSYKEGSKTVHWSCTGSPEFEMEETDEARDRGTTIVLHLSEDSLEYAEDAQVEALLKKYCRFLPVPIAFGKVKEWKDGKYVDTDKDNIINNVEPLWTRKPADITEEQYKEFYKHLSHDFEDPLTWAHNRVEGELEYTSLLYVPTRAPWDLYTRDKVHGLKLFVQRVFIMDEAEQFLPNYLRFIRGLVDTNDLPLNVSRELLQESAVTQKLKRALTKRVLGMLGKLSEDKEKYAIFWKNFGNVLKEGPVEDFTNREEVAKLLRFASTRNTGDAQDVSLADYIAKMPEKQKRIYYLVSGSYASAATSPYLESFKKKGIEVLLMWERIDEWLMGNLTEFEGKKFVPVTAADLDLGELEDKPAEKKQEEVKAAQPLVDRFKKALGEKVTDVRVSDRLVESPSCVTAEHGQILTAQMRRMLEAAGQEVPEEKFILEINPQHALVQKAAQTSDDAAFAKWAEFIYEEALLSEQGSLKDPNAFVRRLNELLLA